MCILTWHGGSRNAGKEKGTRDAELGFARAGKAEDFPNGDHLFVLFVIVVAVVFVVLFGRLGAHRRRGVILVLIITVATAGSCIRLFGWQQPGRILGVMLKFLHDVGRLYLLSLCCDAGARVSRSVVGF